MIKVGYLVSYDYPMIFTSLRQIYDHVDAITIAIDANRRTWTGNTFDLAPAFFAEIARLDRRRIITIYEDDFCLPSLSPMANETRERNMVAARMGDGWLMQLDVDEYIYGFAVVAAFLRQHDLLCAFPRLTPIVFTGTWITLFKRVPDGFLYIENHETFAFVTNVPAYAEARRNPAIPSHDTDIQVIHQSWARDIDEIVRKVENWGHSDDVHRRYVEFWKTVDSRNYRTFRNFHPTVPEVWDELHFLPCAGIDEFIETYATQHPQQPTPMPAAAIAKQAARSVRRRLGL